MIVSMNRQCPNRIERLQYQKLLRHWDVVIRPSIGGLDELQTTITQHPEIMISSKGGTATADRLKMIHLLRCLMTNEGLNRIKSNFTGGRIEGLRVISHIPG